jgi:hypothetical protein
MKKLLLLLFVSVSFCIKALGQDFEWTKLGNGNDALQASGGIYSLCIDAIGDVYALAAFHTDTGKYYIAKWNGNN